MDAPEEIDCDGTDDPVCPWCGDVGQGSEFCLDGREEEYDCDACGKPYVVTPDYSVTYSTRKKEA